MNRRTALYLITCLVTGELYVGVTYEPQVRWTSHLWSGRTLREASKLHYAISRYGAETFTYEILHVYDSRAEAIDAEIDLIAHLNLIEKGLNQSVGGQGGATPNRGPHSAEAHKRMSAAAQIRFEDPAFRERLKEICRKRSENPVWRAKIKAMAVRRKDNPDYIQKQRDSHLGKKLPPRTQEYRDKVRQRLKGRPKSPEHLAAMREQAATPEGRARQAAILVKARAAQQAKRLARHVPHITA